MPYMTYSQLKDSARFRLEPIMGKLVGVTVIFYALRFVAGRFSSVFGLLTDSFALQVTLSSIFMILAGIISSLLEIGFRCLMLKLYCGRPVSTGDLLYAFTAQIKTALGLSTVMSLLSTLPLIPSHVLFKRVELAMESIALSSDSPGTHGSDVHRVVLLYARPGSGHHAPSGLFPDLLPDAGLPVLQHKEAVSEQPSFDARSQRSFLLYPCMHPARLPDRRASYLRDRPALDHTLSLCGRDGILS